ncbi:hypothetical protein POTOM_046342 [Populus tomentosa]|uniref:Uncharacterized protein n=1 Tax=Populus tomentosa TaxID=118781 RepID=A0A8X7YJ01_POPTO|nr:hypothetical protein POTOM_046342 [Populus tomentosa]
MENGCGGGIETQWWWWWTMASMAKLGWGISAYKRGFAGDSRLMPLKAFAVASLFVGSAASASIASLQASGIHKVQDLIELGENIRTGLGVPPRVAKEHIELTLWDSIIVVDKERAQQKLKNSFAAVADKEVEEAIVSIILENFPSHAVFGEETKKNSNDIIIIDTKLPDSFRVDPIDVTYSFNLEKVQVWNPYCSSLQGEAYSWHYDQPVTKDRWMGVTGSISTKNGEPLLATACQDLVHARVHVKSRHYSDEAGFACDGIVRTITIMQRHYSDPGDYRRTYVVFNPRLFPW